MGEEIGEAVKLLEVSINSMELGVKASREGLALLKRLAVLLFNLIKFSASDSKYIKDSGRTNIKNLRKKSTDFGGVVPVNFICKEDFMDFHKAAKKAGILFCCEAPQYKDGSFKAFVSKQDIDLVNNILDKDVYQKAIKRRQQTTGKSFDEAEKDIKENDRIESFSEYAHTSGILDCPMEKFDEINQKYFGGEYENLDDLKKKLNSEYDYEKTIISNKLGKALHETGLIDDYYSNNFINLKFDLKQVYEAGDTLKVQSKNVPNSIVEIPAERVLRNGNKFIAVIPKDMEIKEEIYNIKKDGNDKKVKERSIKAHDYIADINNREDEIKHKKVKKSNKKTVDTMSRKGGKTIK